MSSGSHAFHLGANLPRLDPHWQALACLAFLAAFAFLVWLDRHD